MDIRRGPYCTRIDIDIYELYRRSKDGVIRLVRNSIGGNYD